MYVWDWKVLNVCSFQNRIIVFNDDDLLSLVLIIYFRNKWLDGIEVLVFHAKQSIAWKLSDLKIGLGVSVVLQSPVQIIESHQGSCKSATISDVTYLSLLFQTVFYQWSTGMNLCPSWQRNNRRIAQLPSTAISSSRSRSSPVLGARVSSVTRTIFTTIRNLSAASRRDLIVLTALIARNTCRTCVHTCAGSIPAIKYMPSTCAK